MKYRIMLVAALAALAACGGGDDAAAPPPPPEVASITLTASRQAIVTGDSVLLTAEVRDTQGRTVTGKVVQWTSSLPTVATVSSAGLLRGVSEGDATITASVDGKSASLAFTIRNVFLETDRRVSATIGPAGGSLTTAIVSGVSYQLQIPAGAVDKPTAITMTPVTALRGATFSGGTLGAVQFGPSGLAFQRPVRLRISGVTAPTGGRVPFGFVAGDSGRLESLVPSSFANGIMTVIVPHFSVIGAGAELPAVLSTFPIPSSAQSLQLQQITTLLAQNATASAINASLAGWGQVISTLYLAIATSSTSALLTAVVEYALWTSTIDFVAQQRTDLLSIASIDPLKARLATNGMQLGDGIQAAVVRHTDACRQLTSLAEAEAALFWQDQARELGLAFLDLLPVDGVLELSRGAVLDYLKQQCFTIIPVSTSLADPMNIGTGYVLDTRFAIGFKGQANLANAPFHIQLFPTDVTVSPDSGRADATGHFVTQATAKASARALGFINVAASACVILPGQAALGAAAQASDVCLTEDIERPVTLYSNDFSGAVGTGWSTTTVSTSPSGQRFLGELGFGSALLVVDSLPLHTQLQLDFDLYIIDSWNGNGGVGSSAAPDVLTFEVQGGAVVKRTTFSNKPRDAQAFPGDHPGSAFPAGQGSLALSTLGYPPGSDYIGDSSYRIRLRFAHTASILGFIFGSQQTSGQNERWGIDNVKLSIFRP